MALKIKVTKEGPSTLGASNGFLRMFSLSARHLKCSGMSLRWGEETSGSGSCEFAECDDGSKHGFVRGILYANGGIALWAVRRST